MKCCKRLVVVALLVSFTGLVARAEVKVVIERSREADATADFKFKKVPVPVKNNAASKAKFTIVDGTRDDNGGELEVLHDEINVIDAPGRKPPQAAAGPPARLVSKSPASAKYQITIDYTDTPELKDWVEKTLQPTSDTWYPKIIKALPSENYTPPTNVSIVITNKYRGVAATGGTHVECSAEWFRRNYNGEAPGAVVHELVHVVQQYGRARRGARNPGWLVEGIADYIRWFKYEPKPTGTRPRNPDSANYTDSYRTTAGFLSFVVEKHDKELVAQAQCGHAAGQV